MNFSSLDAAVPRHPVIIGDRRIKYGGGTLHWHVYPATGRITHEPKLASPQKVDEAMQAARAALLAWRAWSDDKRRDLMLKMTTTIEVPGRELAELSTLENGCPSMVAPFIAADASQKFCYFGGWGDKIQARPWSGWRNPRRAFQFAAIHVRGDGEWQFNPAEMQEFVLQYAVHGGWPKASVMQRAVLEMDDRVTKGVNHADGK